MVVVSIGALVVEVQKLAVITRQYPEQSEKFQVA